MYEALRLAPDAAAVHHAIGMQRVRAHAYDEALQHLKRASELAPNDADYGYVYAIALFDTDSASAAEAVIALLLRPGKSKSAKG